MVQESPQHVGVRFFRSCVASFDPLDSLEAAAEVEAHSRFTIEEDGRIAPNVLDQKVGCALLGISTLRILQNNSY